MYLGQKKIRDDLKAKVEAMIAAPSCCQELKDAANAWLETYDDGNKNQAPTAALIKAMEENVSSIDDCIGFLSSDMGKQIYGDAQPAALAAAEAKKAAGGTTCTCTACELACEILEGCRRHHLHLHRLRARLRDPRQEGLPQQEVHVDLRR